MFREIKLSAIFTKNHTFSPEKPKAEILLPSFCRIKKPTPNHQFQLPESYIRQGLMESNCPRQDLYEADSDDLIFLKGIKSITESQFCQEIEQLEHHFQNNAPTNISSVSTDVHKYWNIKRALLGRPLLRKYQRAANPYFQNKKIIAQKANKKTFKHYDLNALIAQNKLSLAVLKLAKEREKLRKSILKFEHQQFNKLNIANEEFAGLKDPYQLIKHLTINKQQSCGLHSCLYNQFSNMPSTYLSHYLIQVMAKQYESVRQMGIDLPWPKNCTVIKMDCIQNEHLIVRPWNKLGVEIQENFILMGDLNKLMILEKMDEKTKVTSIVGKLHECSFLNLDFDDIHAHGREYLTKENEYVQNIRRAQLISKGKLFIDLQISSSDEVAFENDQDQYILIL